MNTFDHAYKKQDRQMLNSVFEGFSFGHADGYLTAHLGDWYFVGENLEKLIARLIHFDLDNSARMLTFIHNRERAAEIMKLIK